MGYWTCWYESVKRIAPKAFHTSKHHTIHKSLLSKKIIHHTSNLTLKKVCIYTGTLGAGVGGIGGGIEKLVKSHTQVPTDPGILLPPTGGIPSGFDPGFVPGFDPGIGGWNPGGYDVIPPYTGIVVTPGDNIPTIPNQPDKVPEPSSIIIFLMAVLVFLVVRHITDKK
jgi:hypothetical protein